MLIEPETLSARERDCLLLVAKGRSSKEIAIDLGITPNTVKAHLRNGASKLGISPPRRAARALEAALDGGPPPNQKGINAPEDLVEKEDLTAVSHPKRIDEQREFQLSLLRFGRQFVTISPGGRLARIPLVAVLLLALGAMIANLYGVLEMVRQLQR